jgi:ferrous iron transport protein B
MSEPIKVALIGNPNTGKTSLFNILTGLNQKVGNYPGITVDKKVGSAKLSTNVKAQVIDLPGAYSMNPSSLDEDIAVKVLTDKSDKYYPDVVIVVVDVENLKRNLLLYTQVKDLGLPTILAINMQDQMKGRGISIDIENLEKDLETKIALISSKRNKGFYKLKELILNYKSLSVEPCFRDVEGILDKSSLQENQKKHRETIKRYQFLTSILNKWYGVDKSKVKDLRSRLDAVLTHHIAGYIIFFSILFLIFQALFSWSEIPMDFIDGSFASLSEWVKNNLPSGVFTSLLSEGIIPGIGGIAIFIPQIAFLFLFLSVLEESGYMSRVVFLMDRVMKRYGLSGKSVVPLISGTACAIPAIMAARNIESWKERLITILVTPFTTCSARIPVYAIIISLVIPNERVFGGIINLQGLTLMLLYLLGFITAIGAAYVLDKILKIKSKSYFVIEMPDYKQPLLKNVLYHMLEKTKSFVFEAGKIILAISILLWVLASYGPGNDFKNAENIVTSEYKNLAGEELNAKVASFKLENSYIGILGKTVEPIIRPLGYDWKIGIALITSFAAREVFVGTLATIYSVGSDEEISIKNKMAKEVHPDTLKPIYNFASGISLLLFYAFAMQCMSTIAIVKRETNGWKWPMIQLFGMTGFAYISALIAFQILK